MMLTRRLYSEVGHERLLPTGSEFARVHVNLVMMSRVLAVVTASLLLLCPRMGAADTVDLNVHQLSKDNPYKVRLAAALALSKQRDARAVLAVADALDKDDEATVRRVAALALEKMLDSHTPDDARELAFDALDKAADTDGDSKVRDTALRARKALSGLRKAHGTRVAIASESDRPEVFVHVETGTDLSKRAPSDAPGRMSNIVRASVEKTGYATSWPGGLPTSSELTSHRSRAFIVASTVKRVDIERAGRRTNVSCTVTIRIAPWGGKDGGEKWEATKAASASGSAKATTGNSEREIAGGVRDCVDAVAEDVAARQVVPFLKRLAQAGS